MLGFKDMWGVVLLAAVGVMAIVVIVRRRGDTPIVRSALAATLGAIVGAVPGIGMIISGLSGDTRGFNWVAAWATYLGGLTAGVLLGLHLLRPERRRSGWFLGALVGLASGIACVFSALLVLETRYELLFIFLIPPTVLATTLAGYVARQARV